MIDSDALIAPISPPLTGASSMSAPSSRARPVRRRAAAGAIVLQSIRIDPCCSVENTPLSPSRTRSTSGESGTIVTIRVARRATSAGFAARSAPASTSASTGAGLRLWTTMR
jgi:hypothetical protein